MMMKVTFSLLLFCFSTVLQANSQKTIDKSAFYTALEAGNAEEIDAQLNIVKTSANAEKIAYEGTLLMKKAGMVGKPKDKLKLFKTGRTKLESSIASDKENTEYRFLRLIIQEHAPKIVKYKSNLEEDSQLIRSNFSSVSASLQQIILDYSKKSKILKIS